MLFCRDYSLFGIYFRNQALYFSCKRISLLLFSLVSLSFLCLVYSFLIDDFSVAYVAQNSNLNLPFYFKFAATWGAHEGSLILWIFAMNTWLLGFIYLTKSDDESFSLVTFSIACQVMFAFSLFTLFTRILLRGFYLYRLSMVQILIPHYRI